MSFSHRWELKSVPMILFLSMLILRSFGIGVGTAPRLLPNIHRRDRFRTAPNFSIARCRINGCTYDILRQFRNILGNVPDLQFQDTVTVTGGRLKRGQPVTVHRVRGRCMCSWRSATGSAMLPSERRDPARESVAHGASTGCGSGPSSKRSWQLCPRLRWRMIQ